MRWFRTVAVVSVGLSCLIAAVFLFLPNDQTSGAGMSSLRLDQIPFDGARAYDYLKQLCDLGPRMSGSPGMEAQQKLLVAHFTGLGAKVRLQRFRARHPAGEADVANESCFAPTTTRCRFPCLTA